MREWIIGGQPWNGLLTILNRPLPASAPIQAGVRVAGGSWFHAAYEPETLAGGAINHINRDVFFVPPEVEPRGPA